MNASRLTLAWVVLAALSGCMVGTMGQPTVGSANTSTVPGTYDATYEGEAYELTLHPDGRATLNGQVGTWQLQNGTLYVSDGEQQVMAMVQDDQITVYLPGGAVVFTRRGGAVASTGEAPGMDPEGEGDLPPDHGTDHGADSGAQPSRPPVPPAPAFDASRALPGKTVTSGLAAARFQVPKGWRQTSEGGAVTLTPPRGQGGIAISYRPLNDEESRARPSVLLARAISELAQGQPTQAVTAPEDLPLGGHPGARAIVRADANGTQLELYAGGIVFKGYAWVVAGLYPASDAEANRPAVDTVLASIQPQLPRENAGLRQRLLGCWEAYSGSTDSSGYGSSTRRIILSQDGTYWYRSTSIVSAAGAGSATSESTESGRFRVEGNRVMTMSDKGEASTYEVELRGGILYVGRDKFLPCKG